MSESDNRNELLENLTTLVCTVDRSHTVRVAIDGVDASGKTTLANELAPLIEKCGRLVIRASIDGFHNPREIRYQRGTDSPEGYYFDSFNYEILRRDLLIPLGPGGNRKYRRAAFNFRENAATPEAWDEAPANGILLFDGVFLLRPGLIHHWDFSIFLDVDFKVSVLRAVARDVAQREGQLTPETVVAKYNQRYVPGQRIYLAEAKPLEHATVIIQNNDLANPKLILS